MNSPWQDDGKLDIEYVDTSAPEIVISQSGGVAIERLPVTDTPSVTERVWQKARDKLDAAFDAPDTFSVPEKKAMICIICGHLTDRRGNKPIKDENNVVWCLCPNDCEPPQEMGTEATMIPLNNRVKDTEFDVWALSPGDFMGPTVEEVKAKAQAESVSEDDNIEDRAVLHNSPTDPDVCDRYGQSLGHRWTPIQRQQPPSRE